jgi:hypothetical protein
MNIEFETRKILNGGFSKKDKVKLIQRISNFREEDIIFALNKQYEDERDISGKIYTEIVKLSWVRK